MSTFTCDKMVHNNVLLHEELKWHLKWLYHDKTRTAELTEEFFIKEELTKIVSS